jgi:hypothetical protein
MTSIAWLMSNDENTTGTTLSSREPSYKDTLCKIKRHHTRLINLSFAQRRDTVFRHPPLVRLLLRISLLRVSRKSIRPLGTDATRCMTGVWLAWAVMEVGVMYFAKVPLFSLASPLVR